MKYSYTNDGQIEDIDDARGIHTHYGYDSLNRLTTITYSNETTTTASGTPIRTPNVIYTYDEAQTGYFNKGRLTKVETKPQGSSTPETVQEREVALVT